jgi:tetratricopeptide (TPR) repeat protein
MGESLKVFVSHTSQDSAFCRTIVSALRGAGADVWYDEHNLDSGRLGPTIERELRARPIFVIILSPAALHSQWVEDEARWAYGLQRKDAHRVIQPVVAAAIKEDDIWLFLQDFKRIEAPSQQPYTSDETARRLLHALGLSTVTDASQPRESVDDLKANAKALIVKDDYYRALPLLERFAQIDPGSLDAWGWNSMGIALFQHGRYEDAIDAFDRVTTLDLNYAVNWKLKGRALSTLGREEEALVAIGQALILSPDDVELWEIKCFVLYQLKRYEEALASNEQSLVLGHDLQTTWNWKSSILRTLGRTAEADVAAWVGEGVAFALTNRTDEALNAYDQALAIDPNCAVAWVGKGSVLRKWGQYASENPEFYGDRDKPGKALKLYQEALDAHDRALAINPNEAAAWVGKGDVLREWARLDDPYGRFHGDKGEMLKHYEEAMAAYDRALAIQPNRLNAWLGKGRTLFELSRYEEALAAYDRALAIEPKEASAWSEKSSVLDQLGRHAEAVAAKDQAKKPDSRSYWRS